METHKNNPRKHPPQQNKKAVLASAAYFKVSTPARKVVETIILPRSAFSLLYNQFYRSLTATFIDHWVLKVLFFI